MLALWACRAMSCRARCCRTGPAASVRVCLSRAETISLAQVAWRRAACFFSLAAIRVLPAFFSAVGAASGRYGLQGRVMGQAGSQDGLEGGAGLGGALAPDVALGLIDLACQVQVETSEHAQCRGALL